MQFEEVGPQVNLGYLKHQIDIKIANILSFLKTPCSNSNISRRIQTQPDEIFKEDKQSTIITNDYHNLATLQTAPQLPIDDFYAIGNVSHITSNKSLGPIYTQRTRNPPKFNTNYKPQHHRAVSNSLNQQDISKISAKPPVSHKNPQFEQAIKKRKQQQSSKVVKRDPIKTQIITQLSTQIMKNYTKERKQTTDSYKTRAKLIQRVAKMEQKSKKI